MLLKGLQQLLSTPKDNVQLLDLLSSQRDQLAKLMGEKSYAAYWMRGGTLAQAPEAVVTFLRNLNTALQPQVSFLTIT